MTSTKKSTTIHPERSTLHLSHDTLESVLEPLDGLLLVDLVRGANLANCSPALGDTGTRSGHAAVEVHAVDTDRRVVLDTKIDMLADAEAEVAGLGEVALSQLVFLDLEATLDDFLGLGAADCDVDGDLFVTADTECSHGVAGLACFLLSVSCPFPFMFGSKCGGAYYRLGFDRSIARAPLRHE